MNVMSMSGIRVSVLKHQGRSFANGGISDRCDEAILILPEGGPSVPSPRCPAIKIVPGAFAGTATAVVVDRDPNQGGIGPMMGGCYVSTSDSRFGREVARVTGGPGFYGAIPLHDRFETQAQYDRLSR